MPSSNCCFFSYIQVFQEAGQVVWYSHLFQNFPQFIVIHTVKGFGIVNKVEVDIFQELSCFFFDPTDIGNLISGSSEKEKVKVNLLSCVRLFATPWTVAYQAPLSMGFSKQEYWSGLPFPSPGDLPNSGIGHRSSKLQADALPSEPPGSLNIWKFSVHILLKPSLENFQHFFASMWNECNCVVVWTFFGIAFLWN